jgi:predicted amidohydrolase YtcJ
VRRQLPGGQVRDAVAASGRARPSGNSDTAGAQPLDRGSLEEGKRADLVVLTEDPFSVPEARLKEVTSALTLVKGRVGWSK